MGPTFQFEIKKDDNTWYALHPDGTVYERPEPYYLKFALKGWEETTISWIRDPEYHGIGSFATTPYEAVHDAKDILRYVKYTYGRRGKARLIINLREEFDLGSVWQYKPWYAADIDIAKAVDTRDGVAATLLGTGIAEVLKAKQRTPVEIPLLNADAIKVLFNGVILKNSASFFMTGNPSGDNENTAHTPQLIVSTLDTYGNNTQGVQYTEGTGPPDDPRWFLKASVATSVVIDYDFTLTTNSLPGINYGLALLRSGFVVIDAGNTTSTSYNLISENNSVIYLGTTYHPIGQITIALNAGDKLYYTTRLAGSPSGPASFIYGTITPTSPPSLKIAYDSRQAQRQVPSYRYFQLFQKVVSEAISPAAVGSSPILTNPFLDRNSNWDMRFFNIAATCGDALRGLGDGSAPATAAKIKTTIADCAKHICNAGMLAMTQLNNQLSIVPLAAVYQDVEIASLGEVSGLEISEYESAFFNNLKNGGQAQDYDSLNGRDEYNQGQTRNSGDGTLSEDRDWTSPYRYDPLGIDFHMANLAGKTTTDSGQDNETFLADIGDFLIDGFYPLYRPASQNAATGVFSPSSKFNFSMTPARDIRRNGPRIAPAFHLVPGGVLTFQTADKNAALSVNLGAGTVTENADIPAAELGPMLYKPILFKFTAKTPINLLELMAVNPHGYFTFTSDEMTFKGFPMDIGTRPATHETYECILLAHPTTDTNQLINR